MVVKGDWVRIDRCGQDKPGHEGKQGEVIGGYDTSIGVKIPALNGEICSADVVTVLGHPRPIQVGDTVKVIRCNYSGCDTHPGKVGVVEEIHDGRYYVRGGWGDAWALEGVRVEEGQMTDDVDMSQYVKKSEVQKVALRVLRQHEEWDFDDYVRTMRDLGITVETDYHYTVEITIQTDGERPSAEVLDTFIPRVDDSHDRARVTRVHVART
jgi:hypothetical protein